MSTVDLQDDSYLYVEEATNL